MTSSKNTNINNPTLSQDIPASNVKNSPNENFKVVVPSLSLITVILIMIGYGYERAFADRFNLDISDIASSPLDFLLAAPEALVLMLSKMFENFSFMSIWQSAKVQSIIFGVVIVFVFFVYDFFLRKGEQREAAAKSAQARTHQIKTFFINNRVIQYISVALVAVGLTPIAAFIVYMVIVLVMLIPLLIVLIFGFTPGLRIAEDYIIKPTKCAPLIHPILAGGSNKKTDKNEIFATCVAVIKDGKEIVRGRRIASHAERIFLYIKNSGEVRAVPLNDATVVLVDSEEPLIKNDVNIQPQDSAKAKIEKQGDVK